MKLGHSVGPGIGSSLINSTSVRREEITTVASDVAKLSVWVDLIVMSIALDQHPVERTTEGSLQSSLISINEKDRGSN